MEKSELIEKKKKLLALGLIGTMIGTVGYSNNKDNISNYDNNTVPEPVSISSKYSKVSHYYKYEMQEDEEVQLYNSQNVFLYFDKETYEVAECIYDGEYYFCGFGSRVELYDLPSEEMLVYADCMFGLGKVYNEEYYDYLRSNSYIVCLAYLDEYVEGYTSKEYYSLDEIRELEPQIVESLKIINSTRVRTK